MTSKPVKLEQISIPEYYIGTYIAYPLLGYINTIRNSVICYHW